MSLSFKCSYTCICTDNVFILAVETCVKLSSWVVFDNITKLKKKHIQIFISLLITILWKNVWLLHINVCMFVGALIFLLNCLKYNTGVVGNLLNDFLLASLFFFLLDLIIYNLLFCKQSTEIRIPLADNKNTPILKNHCQKSIRTHFNLMILNI